MKNILDPTVKEEILMRIDRLTPQSKALWGKMNVCQGLRHMFMAFDIPTGRLDPTPDDPPKMPKWLFKFFVLNMKPPKEKVKTFKEMNTVNNGINPTDFEAERSNLKMTIEDFARQTSYIPENKLGGSFNMNNWGKLCYNHTDHHLRQFGV